MIDKKISFKSDQEREVGVCISIQKLGLASIQEIIDKIAELGAKVTEKQVGKICKQLQNRQIISVDLSGKDKSGNIEQKYLMKKINVTIPEVANLKDITDSAEVKDLIEFLEKSKKANKRICTNEYYRVDLKFKTKGNIQGFIPDDKETIRHYREGKKIIFFPYHFKNWMRSGLNLVDRYDTAAQRLEFDKGIVETNGNDLHYIDKWVTNTSGGASSRTGGGRGCRKIECLPEDAEIQTNVLVSTKDFSPEKFKEALKIIGHRRAFGGGAKLSTGRLVLEEFDFKGLIWEE